MFGLELMVFIKAIMSRIGVPNGPPSLSFATWCCNFLNSPIQGHLVLTEWIDSPLQKKNGFSGSTIWHPLSFETTNLSYFDFRIKSSGTSLLHHIFWHFFMLILSSHKSSNLLSFKELTSNANLFLGSFIWSSCVMYLFGSRRNTRPMSKSLSLRKLSFN